MPQYDSDDLYNKVNILLESIENDDKCQENDQNDELDEGTMGDLASKIAKAIAGGGKELAQNLAKGTLEGILGSKEERLLQNAAKNFTELLNMSGIKVSIETTQKLLNNILTKNVIKFITTKREQDKQGSGKEFTQMLQRTGNNSIYNN